MELLERDKYLTVLETAFEGLKGGGLVILISGEAGIGKTSLVENFIKKTEDRANILWGACDDLFTPRPLGPLYDIAAQLKNGLAELLNRQVTRPEIFTRFLNDLQKKVTPSVVVLEDVHWADESTLDLIKFIGRRADKTNSLFIITYRDDEIDPGHPLRSVLGDIPSKNLIRIKLPSLTEKTVNAMASLMGINNLFLITGGNPFLIAELLNNRNGGIPATIKDSILTRVSKLSAAARDLVELVSVVPTKVEKRLASEIIPIKEEILDECLNCGILKLEGEYLSFKHELSRMACEESLTESKRQLLNEKVLQVLLKQKILENYLARIIHHAGKAQNKAVIIKYAPKAADQASALGAHKLAAEHYGNALKYAESISPEEKINLFEGRSYECYLTGQVEEAIKAGETAIELLRKWPDPRREGENYRRIAKMLWYNCDEKKGEEYIDKAIKILEKLPPGKYLAMAYSNKSQTYMLREETGPAIRWGEKALRLARELNEEETEAHALNNIGTAKMFEGDDSGEEYLKKSLELSLKNNFYEHTMRAYINLGSLMLQKRRMAEADKYFSEGTEYCSGKDLYIFSLCMAGHNANTRLYTGHWNEAAETAAVVFKKENIPFGNRIIPLLVIGIIRARRGDPGAMKMIEEADLLAPQIGETDKIVAVKSVKAEAYWLQNKLDEIIDEVEEVYNKIKLGKNPWEIGQIAYWLCKGNRLPEIPSKIAMPFMLQIKGDWKSAAGLWKELDCPYEQAMALSEGNEEAMRKAVELFDHLGATAASHLIKQKMRISGLKSIPKGPIKTTRKNPAGLTGRQLEVLNLLGKGLSNNEIGNRLYISPKTVDHHISAILSKLNIHSRHEAAAFLQSAAAVKK